MEKIGFMMKSLYMNFNYPWSYTSFFLLYLSKIKLDTSIYVASILLSPCYFCGENTNFLVLFIYFTLSHLYVFQKMFKRTLWTSCGGIYF